MCDVALVFGSPRAGTLQNLAVPNKSFDQSLALVWTPRVDGVFLSHSPQKLVQEGKVADIPFITGDCDDEGTLFSLSSRNITYAPDCMLNFNRFVDCTMPAGRVRNFTTISLQHFFRIPAMMK
jgi:carboxylesterase type B